MLRLARERAGREGRQRFELAWSLPKEGGGSPGAEQGCLHLRPSAVGDEAQGRPPGNVVEIPTLKGRERNVALSAGCGSDPHGPPAPPPPPPPSANSSRTHLPLWVLGPPRVLVVASKSATAGGHGFEPVRVPLEVPTS